MKWEEVKCPKCQRPMKDLEQSYDIDWEDEKAGIIQNAVRCNHCGVVLSLRCQLEVLGTPSVTAVFTPQSDDEENDY